MISFSITRCNQRSANLDEYSGPNEAVLPELFAVKGNETLAIAEYFLSVVYGTIHWM